MTFADRPAYIITGPTSGFGLATALELARHGRLVLVGRDARRLAAVRERIERSGGEAVGVVCDMSDIDSVRKAAAEIAGLGLPLAGLLNNAGIVQMVPTRSAQGWDLSYATNHLGPFVLTEALLPHLPDGANVVFIVSAVEDPERGPARAAGFRGARYISAAASAQGEWLAGGSAIPGGDAYATSKQSELAAAFEFARENPRLYVNAVELGFAPGTSLGRDANVVLQWLGKYVLNLMAPHIRYWSTPRRSARVITDVLLNKDGKTGVYFDERGRPMLASRQVRDPAFTARVVRETRELLRTQAGAVGS
jgi:NAD(P)-dependent dehydrogenase (short-subunit alcohol dehydrogenase family)